jgi:hypothetical protein
MKSPLKDLWKAGDKLRGRNTPTMRMMTRNKDNDYNYSLPSPAPHPPSVITSASSQTLAVPSVTISQLSSLPISTIASLTHDELWHNPEFMKHVNLVSLLQELLNLQKTMLSNFCCESPPSHCLCSSLMCFFLAAKPLSTSSSLAPSQSASQVLSSLVHSNTFMSFPCKAKCPNKFLPSILWMWEDCKTDPLVGMSSSNMSRPPMQHAICHEDSSMLSEGRVEGDLSICNSHHFTPTWIPSPLLPKLGPTSHARRCISSTIF